MPADKLPQVDPNFFDPFGLGSLPPEFWEDDDEPGLSPDYRRRFRQHVCDSRECEQALEKLQQIGLPQKTIEAHLAGFAQPQKTKKDYERAAVLSARLVAHKKHVNRFLRQLTAFQAQAAGKQVGPVLDTQNVRLVLEHYASALGALCRYHSRHKSRKGKSGRRNDAHLVWLWLLVKAISGRPHNSELAYLAGAALEAQYRRRHEFYQDSVRKIVTRFRRREKALYTFWEAVLGRAANAGVAAYVPFMPWLGTGRENEEKLLHLASSLHSVNR